MRTNLIGKVGGYLLCWWAFFVSAQAQLPIHHWRTHYMYSNAQGIAAHGGSVYGFFRHSLLRYDLKTGEISPFTATKGLHTASISALMSTAAGLVIGYEDGQVDVLDETHLYHLQQLKNTKLHISKHIYTAFASSQTLYVGGNFGLIAFDRKTWRVQDSYTELSDCGAVINCEEQKTTVYGIAVHADSLFLATSEGIIHANIKDPGDLLDYRKWKRPVSAKGKTSHLVEWKGDIFALNRLSTGQLLRYEESDWHVQKTFNEPYEPLTFLAASSKGLVTGGGASLYYAPENGAFQKVPLPANSAVKLKGAAYVDKKWWISDEKRGIGQWDNQAMRWLHIKAPSVPMPSKIRSIGQAIYAFSRSNFFPQIGTNQGKAARFINRRWENMALEQVVDVLQIPSGMTYIATYEDGISQVLPSKLVPLRSTEQLKITALAHTGADELLVATIKKDVPALHLYEENKSTFPVSLDMLRGALQLLRSQPAWEQVWAVLDGTNGEQLLVFSSKNVRNIRIVPKNPPFIPNKVHEIAIDQSDRLWIATSIGLFLLPESYNALTEPGTPLIPERLHIAGRPVLEEDAVYGLAIDEAERLWCSTAQGIWLIDLKLDEIRQIFTSSNSPLPITGPRDLAITTAGELFVSTAYGLLTYRTDTSKPASENEKIRIFPNPVRADFHGMVAISHLPVGSSVRITTLSGALLRNLRVRGGTATWDTRDERHRLTPAGIYTVHSVQKDGNQSYAGKIAILR